jgi:hypothetical protein
MEGAKSTSVRREFLGWSQSPLGEAVRCLDRDYRQGNSFDLASVVVVLPGSRAGRRLLELLAIHSKNQGLILTPPRVMTESLLPELLYTPKQPFANDITQTLAWAGALRDCSDAQRSHVIVHPPGNEESRRWYELGRLLRNLHTEMAAEGLDCGAVCQAGKNLHNFAETERWQTLALLQRRYLDTLDREKLWDKQTARLVAIKQKEIKADFDIVLFGTVDLNQSMRLMLSSVANRVTAYVVAPLEEEGNFDELGCLKAEAWCRRQVPLLDEQLRQVDGPADQAEAVIDWLADLKGEYASDEVTIGVPDEMLVPQLQRQLEQCGVPVRWVEGTRIGDSAPYRLLAAAVNFAGKHDYDDFSALARHPDIETWLKPRPALAAQLDAYYQEYLPNRLFSSHVGGDQMHWPDLRRSLDHIERWLGEAGREHSLREWSEVFANLLDAIYGGRSVDLQEDAALYAALRKMLERCGELLQVPVAVDALVLNAADAFRIAFAALADEFLPPPPNAAAVEILGWLELPLDDAPALIVTSFNDGFVPKSTGADAFLPDRLRRELRLVDNERRYARDAYATTVLSQSRKAFRVICARRNAQDDPLQPSRLLFACADNVLVGRAGRLFQKKQEATGPRRLWLTSMAAIPNDSKFTVPPPETNGFQLDKISVTRFREYLACPYRYYLRHVRKLQSIDDMARELLPSTFGQLLHGALSQLGLESVRDKCWRDEADLFEFLDECLSARAEKQFGSDGLRPAVRLQIEQARRRLQAFARPQMELFNQGWKITYTEDPLNESGSFSTPLAQDGRTITLIGRIDRIDRHDATQALRVIDYKSADNPHTPDQTHLRDGAWVDLQLPLYRHFLQIPEFKLPSYSTIKLAYFNLPRQVEKTAVEEATWSDQELQAADAKAWEVIDAIRQGIFWPPCETPPQFNDGLGAICLDNIMGGPPLASLESEDSP